MLRKPIPLDVLLTLGNSKDLPIQRGCGLSFSEHEARTVEGTMVVGIPQRNDPRLKKVARRIRPRRPVEMLKWKKDKFPLCCGGAFLAGGSEAEGFLVIRRVWPVCRQPRGPKSNGHSGAGRRVSALYSPLQPAIR